MPFFSHKTHVFEKVKWLISVPLSQLSYFYLISFTPQKKFTEFIKINKFTQEENSIEKKRKKEIHSVTDLGNYNHVN